MLSCYHGKVPPLVFAWAILVALSRILLGLYYVDGLLAGAAVGIVMSLVIIPLPYKYSTLHEKTRKKGKSARCEPSTDCPLHAVVNAIVSKRTWNE